MEQSAHGDLHQVPSLQSHSHESPTMGVRDVVIKTSATQQARSIPTQKYQENIGCANVSSEGGED